MFEGVKFSEVKVDELVKLNLETGELEPTCRGYLLLTGEESQDGVKVTVKVHYDISTNEYTVISHDMEVV